MDAGIKTAKKVVYENGVICLSSISSYSFIYLFIYQIFQIYPTNLFHNICILKCQNLFHFHENVICIRYDKTDTV